jgi:hypothetical protein
MSDPVRVFHHDNCFDGIASAAVFSVFYRKIIDEKATFDYEGLAHRAGGYQLDDMLTGNTNVILDFKYSSSDRLTWWFDHHESAFLSPDDEAHFRTDRSGRKFHDPDYRSCTKFIRHVADTVFDCSLGELDNLIHWADIIDGAQFESARTAVELKEPALQLMTVVEAVHDRNLIRRIIGDLQTRTLAGIASDRDVNEHFVRLREKHLNAIEVLTSAMSEKDRVVEFDISDSPIHAHNKFIPYHVFPDSVYTVGVSLEPSRAKVSVGTNPWTRVEPRHNLARICERYGGGGHAVVAAISFRPEEIGEARRVAKEIGETLRRDP